MHKVMRYMGMSSFLLVLVAAGVALYQLNGIGVSLRDVGTMAVTTFVPFFVILVLPVLVWAVMALVRKVTGQARPQG